MLFVSLIRFKYSSKGSKIYKCLSIEYSEIVRESVYNTGSGILLSLPPTKSTRFGINSFIFRASQLWNSLHGHVKKCPIEALFKESLECVDFIKPRQTGFLFDVFDTLTVNSNASD